MAIKLISLRDFLCEISSAIHAAGQQLAQQPVEGPQETPAHSLNIQYVKVNFYARVTNRKLLNAKPVRQDEILLDFTQDASKKPENIHAEIMFSGLGEPIDFMPPQAPEYELEKSAATGNEYMAE